jgi:hypothetical protein
MKLSQLKEEIKGIIRERGVAAIQKEYQKTIEEIEKALDFYKKNKNTDKKDVFVKVLKQLGEKKKALQNELDLKVQSMYRNAELKADESVNEAFKHIIHVDTPTQVVSKPIAAQIMALAKKGVRSKEIGLEMGFTGNAKLAADTFQKVKNQIYFSLDKRNESVNEDANPKFFPNGKNEWAKSASLFIGDKFDILLLNSKLKDVSDAYYIFKKDGMFIGSADSIKGGKPSGNKINVKLSDVRTAKSMGDLKMIVDESVNEADGLWANIRAKQARGEKPAPKNSQAYKDAVKAGKEINKNEEVVNEASFQKGENYGGSSCKGGCFTGKDGLKKIIKISKENPKNTFILKDDNYSGLKPYFIKDGVVALAKTPGNPSYDLDRNKVRNLNIGNDVILLFRVVE